MSNIQDTANQALQQMLTMAVNGLQGAVDFSKAQIPDVIHQMLMWNILNSVLAQVVSVVILVITTFLFCKLIKSGKNRESMFSECGGLTFMGGAVGFVLLALILLFLFNFLDSFDWVEIIVAPKYYLLQQAAHLIK